MKKRLALKLFIALGMALPLPSVHGGGFECAVDAAIEQSPFAFAVLSDHSFDLKPVVMTDKAGPNHTLTGSIVHQQPTGLNDEVAYRIKKQKGAIKEIQLRVNGGDWVPMSQAMTQALGEFLQTGSVEEHNRKKIEKALQQALDGSWLRSAEMLVAYIAMRHC